MNICSLIYTPQEKEYTLVGTSGSSDQLFLSLFPKLVNIKFIFTFFSLLLGAKIVSRWARQKGCLPCFFYSLIAVGNADSTDFPYQAQVYFGISNRALTHKQIYYCIFPFLRKNASFEIIARERQPSH